MYLLYLDDAGSVGNASERYFVLAGVALFERQTWFLEKALDDVASSVAHPEPKKLELHGNEIASGRKFWRSIEKVERRRVIGSGLEAVRKLHGRTRLFGAVVDKRAVAPADAVEIAFEEVASRFDRFLLRLHRGGKTERGLIVLDKSTMETRLQALATEFRLVGHSSGKLTNLADVPFFVDSAASRLVQYADLVAYALWRNFERNDPDFFHAIENLFDVEGGVTHGLAIVP